MTTSVRDTPLINIENPTDLLVTFLYAPGKDMVYGEPVDGATRLQKLMFLLKQGLGPKELVNEALAYKFIPFKMGPFSKELRTKVDELRSAGIISTKRLDYQLPDDDPGLGDEEESDLGLPEERTKKVESYRYYLTDLGQRVGKDLWESLNNEDQKGFKEFKAFFNSLSLRQLLIFSYERFPSYTTKSTIKEQLGF